MAATTALEALVAIPGTVVVLKVTNDEERDCKFVDVVLAIP